MLKSYVRHTLSILLAMALVFSSFACADIDMSQYDYNADLNLIWDIPFNIPMTEFVKKAYEKTGFVFNLEGSDNVSTDPSQTISLLGHTLSNAIAGEDTFGQNKYKGQYCRLLLAFAENESTVDTFSDIFNALCDKFGTFTSASCYILSKNGMSLYDFPLNDESIDLPLLKRIVSENEKHKIDVTWGNITLSLFYGNLTLSASNYVFTLNTEPKSLGNYGLLVKQIKDSDAGI